MWSFYNHVSPFSEDKSEQGKIIFEIGNALYFNSFTCLTFSMSVLKKACTNVVCTTPYVTHHLKPRPSKTPFPFMARTQAPLKNGSLPNRTFRNRLNSTLPSIIKDLPGSAPDIDEQNLFHKLADLSNSSTNKGASEPDPDDPSSQFSIVSHLRVPPYEILGRHMAFVICLLHTSRHSNVFESL